jgi:hypothetical protein
MPDAHSLLSASAAHRWASCPASLKLHNAIPSRSSRSADKGTALHDVSAWRLENGDEPYPHPSVMVAGTEWVLTKEMLDAVETYVAEVRKRTEGATLLVEQRVNYASWLGVEDGLAFGTSDVVALDGDTIHIIDAKFGENPNNRVDAFEVDEKGVERPNVQLACYALGAMHEFQEFGPFTKVRMTIVQPYLDHVSEFEIDATELKTQALRLKAGALTALKHYSAEGAPPLEAFAPSDKACHWCAAKHNCPALAREVETETRDLFGALVEKGPETMAAAIPDDRLAQAMSKIGMLEQFCKAVRAETERRLLAGEPVAGYKLVQGRQGPRKWRDENSAAEVLQKLVGADGLKPAEPISPTTVEKDFVKKGRIAKDDWQKLCENIDRSEGAISVAPVSDPRPAIVRESVEDKFSGLVQIALTPDDANDLV